MIFHTQEEKNTLETIWTKDLLNKAFIRDFKLFKSSSLYLAFINSDVNPEGIKHTFLYLKSLWPYHSKKSVFIIKGLNVKKESFLRKTRSCKRKLFSFGLPKKERKIKNKYKEYIELANEYISEANGYKEILKQECERIESDFVMINEFIKHAERQID